jgi:hypothetical protein
MQKRQRAASSANASMTGMFGFQYRQGNAVHAALGVHGATRQSQTSAPPQMSAHPTMTKQPAKIFADSDSPYFSSKK